MWVAARTNEIQHLEFLQVSCALELESEINTISTELCRRRATGAARWHVFAGALTTHGPFSPWVKRRLEESLRLNVDADNSFDLELDHSAALGDRTPPHVLDLALSMYGTSPDNF